MQKVSDRNSQGAVALTSVLVAIFFIGIILSRSVVATEELLAIGGIALGAAWVWALMREERPELLPGSSHMMITAVYLLVGGLLVSYPLRILGAHITEFISAY